MTQSFGPSGFNSSGLNVGSITNNNSGGGGLNCLGGGPGGVPGGYGHGGYGASESFINYHR